MTTKTKTRTTTAERTDRVAETMETTTRMIVEAIEQGLANPRDWSAPWHNNAAQLPQRVTDGYVYQGGNLFYLWSLVAAGASPYWGTYDQWQEVGGQVRKGQSAAAYLLRPMKATVENQETGAKEQRFTGRFSAFPVWHAHQVDGWTPPPAPERPVHDDAADIDAAFRWMACTGADIAEGGNAAAYSPTLDRVLMPGREQFTSADGAWSTGAHELCHWTGHASRLNRAQEGAFGNRFGTDSYAAEELVAELGAALTMAMLGRVSEPRPDHAQYLASWLRVLKSDAAHLWHVAGKASAAAAYVTERAAGYYSPQHEATERGTLVTV